MQNVRTNFFLNNLIDTETNNKMDVCYDDDNDDVAVVRLCMNVW